MANQTTITRSRTARPVRTAEFAKRKGVENYCENLKLELNLWKVRLYDLLAHENKPKNLEEDLKVLKATMREIETIISKMNAGCDLDFEDTESIIGEKLQTLREYYSKGMEVTHKNWKCEDK